MATRIASRCFTSCSHAMKSNVRLMVAFPHVEGIFSKVICRSITSSIPRKEALNKLYAAANSDEILEKQALAVWDLEALGHTQWRKAVLIYEEVKNSNLPVTPAMYNIFLTLLSNGSQFSIGIDVLNEMLDSGFIPMDSVRSIALQIVQNHIEDISSTTIRSFITELESKGLIIDSETWGVASAVTAIKGNFSESGIILKNMKMSSLVLDGRSAEKLIGELALIDSVDEYIERAQSLWLMDETESDKEVHNILIDACDMAARNI